jgi:hypothetical protein
MGLNKLIFGVLAIGCLAAAGLGGYIAARQTQSAPADSRRQPRRARSQNPKA